MNILVNAYALRFSGALSIYNQFMFHLPLYVNGNKFYIFIDSSVNQPRIPGVTYIIDNNHSWLHRIKWEHGGLERWLKRNHIVPDVIVSLQNTGVFTKCRQVIYYHQPLPFYDWKWSLLKKNERIMWLYKHIYPYFVKSTLNDKTDVVVQIPFIKKKFVEKFCFKSDKVYVLFPDIEHIATNQISCMDWNSSINHFIYPATPMAYKEHRIILEALNLLKRNGSTAFSKIKVHFTFSRGESDLVDELITKYGLEDHILLDGIVPHNILLSYYKSACGLLFPSVIETLGLPLLEAASFGLPIIVSDLEYSHEVLGEYSGAVFVNPADIKKWAYELEKISLLPQKYDTLLPSKRSSWGDFFNLIDGRTV